VADVAALSIATANLGAQFAASAAALMDAVELRDERLVILEACRFANQGGGMLGIVQEMSNSQMSEQLDTIEACLKACKTSLAKIKAKKHK
jgi:hypothetical protein